MSELPDLAEMAQPWMERLRLTDWQIRWRWARHHELGDATGATVRWSLERRGADILIRVPDDESPDGVHVEPEEYVVHELLHIAFNMLDDQLDKTAQMLFERALNATATALVTLRRENESATLLKVQHSFRRGGE